jgi:hypothetical protein
LEEEKSVKSAGAAMVYESAITSVSNDEVKLTTTEVKVDDFGQKIKKAHDAFQDLFTTAIDTGKSIGSEKAKKTCGDTIKDTIQKR